MLFRAVSRTLCEIARDPKHLGAQTGFLAVLHTWSQKRGFIRCSVEQIVSGMLAPAPRRLAMQPRASTPDTSLYVNAYGAVPVER